MSKSLYAPIKAPILRDTLVSEQVTRGLGGVPTSMTYSVNGVTSTASTSRVIYSNTMSSKNPASIRLIVSGLSQSDTRIFSVATAVPSNLMNVFGTVGSNVLNTTSGTMYINGVQTTSYTSGIDLDIVITGLNLTSAVQVILGNLVALNYGMANVTYKLCEVYDYTLTANEVANLYVGKRYEALQYSSGVTEILNVDAKNGAIANKYSGSVIPTNLVTNGDFATDSNWSKGSGWTISGGSANVSSPVSNTNLGQTCMVSGVTYRVTFTISSISSGSIDLVGFSTSSTPRSTVGTFSETLVANSTTLNIRGLAPVAATIDNVVVEAVAPNITNTSTTIVRDGNIWAMDFSTTSSNVNCGSYDTLLGNKTLVMWVKPYYTTSATGSFNAFFNGQFNLQADYGGSAAWYFSRTNFSGTYISAPNTITENQWQMMVVTSTSTGVSIMYKNAAVIASGTVTTPVAGTDMKIGNGTSVGKPRVSGVRVIDGILTAQEISQLFSNERRNYNV